MKKITLFAAVAAMVAASASAAAPEVVKYGTPHRAEASRLTRSFRADKRADLSFSPVIAEAAQSRADGDDVVTITNGVDYVLSSSAFYLSFSTGAICYPEQSYAFTGIRNAIGFLNLTEGADGFDWRYGKVTGINEDRTDYIYDFTNSTDKNLFMELSPLDRFTYPTLSANFGTDTETKAPAYNHSFYHCGRSTDYWGFDVLAAGATEVTSYDELIGVTNCTALPGASTFPEYTIRRPGATGYDATLYNANGASLNWEEAYSDEKQGLKISNVNIKKFGTYVPPMPSAYIMDAMWMWFDSEATADVTLTINVYDVTEDGNVNYDSLIGTGELTVPAGKFSVGETTTMPVIELAAVDADGYAIDAPMSVTEGQDIFIQLEGLDNPNLRLFAAVAYDTTSNPTDTDPSVVNAMWPNRAYAIMDMDLDINGQEISDEFMFKAPYRYFGIKMENGQPVIDRSVLTTVTNFTWMFNVNFPVVMNPDQNSSDYQTANFNVEAPVAGGEISVPVACDYKLDVLLQEELAKGVSSPWLTYNVTFDEETGISTVDLTAEALPEGTPGREGYVVFMGYGIDFVIVVTQGDTSAIDSITVQPVAKGTQFFDLQGRRLSAAPAHGIYIQSVDGKATKHIAR